MKTRGTVSKDGTINVNAPLSDLERYFDKDIDVEIKIHREKRSLSANAYFYVLLDQIASKAKTTAVYQHNLMLSRYGKVDIEMPEVRLRSDIDYLELEELHLRFDRAEIVYDEEGNWHIEDIYHVIRGSHTYNTQEMAELIDGVVEDAQAWGIETMTPDEIKRMEAAWQAQGKARETREHVAKTS